MSETISKASVCEILADIYPTDGEKVVAVMEVDKAYEAIQQLPSAQPDRKKGKWIDSERPKWDGTTYFLRQCSVCGYERTDCNTDLDTAYCPNCGADMRGNDHETD